MLIKNLRVERDTVIFPLNRLMTPKGTLRLGLPLSVLTLYLQNGSTSRILDDGNCLENSRGEIPCGFETHCFRAMANLKDNAKNSVDVNSYSWYDYGYGSRVVKKTTTTKKYNQKGQVIEETVVEETTTFNDYTRPWRNTPYYPYGGAVYSSSGSPRT